MSVLAASLTLIWLVFFWQLTLQRPIIKPLLFTFAVIAGLIAVFLSSPSLWQAVARGYPRDSFFTLDLIGRIGVVAISVFSILLFFMFMKVKTTFILKLTGTTWATRILSLFVDSGIGLALFGFLYALSPQIYYTFYRITFPGLPQKIVIKTVFDSDQLIQIAYLSAEGTLSHHLSGVVFLTIIPVTAWLHAKKWQKQAAVLPVFSAFILIVINTLSQE